MKTIYPFMGLALCSVTAQAQEKPNFLIIQCDHLTQRVVGAYGQTQGCTLPIDEVASRGVIFSNAYVGCPLSQPSRAALWSGMMPHQTNVRSNSSEPINPRIPENVPTLGSLFSENGYEAVHFGKTSPTTTRSCMPPTPWPRATACATRRPWTSSPVRDRKSVV